MLEHARYPITRTFDDRKRRATDLQECSRITLPKPLSTKHEANIEMRRSNNEKIYSKYRGEFCNKRGEVQGNLTPEEKDGLRSLQKRDSGQGKTPKWTCLFLVQDVGEWRQDNRQQSGIK
jgi:hypothetical protein